MSTPNTNITRLIIGTVVLSVMILCLSIGSLKARVHLIVDDWAEVTIPGHDSYTEDQPPSGLYLYPDWWGGYYTTAYPNYWNLFKGISDTVQVEIRFMNNQAVLYPLSGDPGQWFTFALYTNYYTLNSKSPTVSGNDVGRQFIGWKKNERYNQDKFVTQPTSIPPNDGTYSMVFHIWNLPEKQSFMALGQTKHTPVDVSVLNWATGGTRYGRSRPFIVGMARELQDTLNTFLYIGHRYSDMQMYPVAMQWADSILARSPHSIVGWMLKSRLLDNLGEREASLRAIDYTLWIFQEGKDPVYPFRWESRREWGPGMLSVDYDWLEEMYNRTKDFRKYVDSFHEWRGR